MTGFCPGKSTVGGASEVYLYVFSLVTECRELAEVAVLCRNNWRKRLAVTSLLLQSMTAQGSVRVMTTAC